MHNLDLAKTDASVQSVMRHADKTIEKENYHNIGGFNGGLQWTSLFDF